MKKILLLILSMSLVACSTSPQEEVKEETDHLVEDHVEEREEQVKEIEDQEDESEEITKKNEDENQDQEGDSNGPFEIIDATGRTIEFESRPESKVIMGHGALKYYVYVAGIDGIVGIEAAELNDQTLNGQSIHYAYPDLREIEVVGKGGPQFQPDDELLSHMNPDVVFVAYNNTKEELDELEDKIQVPVVGLSTGMHGNIFDDDIKETFAIVGKITGNEERSDMLIQYLDQVEEDLAKRAGEGEDSPQAYLGGTSFRGPQGILSTKTQYALFDILNINNIMDPLTDEASVIIDKEKLIELDPAIIVMDLSGKALIEEDMESDIGFYQNLSAFQEGQVYPIMPYFTYGLNIDTAILDTYYLGKTFYPENFEDVDLRDEAEEVYQNFVGVDVYDQLNEYYDEAFQPIKL